MPPETTLSPFREKTNGNGDGPHRLAEQARAALDEMRHEAKLAWAAFETAREKAVEAEKTEDPDTVAELMKLSADYDQKADRATFAEHNWQAALDGKQKTLGDGAGRKLSDRMIEAAGGHEQFVKNIVMPVGAIVVPDLLDLLVSEDFPTPTILPLLTPQTTTGDQVRFWRSTVETYTTAPVALGAVKPSSVLEVSAQSADVETIATVVLALDRATLLDFPALTAWIDSRLRESIVRTVEQQCLAGSGTKPQLRGILSTPGILGYTAAAGESAMDAIGTGVEILQTSGVQPSAIVVDLATGWAMRKAREDAATPAGPYLLGPPAIAGPPTLWGFQVVQSATMPPDEALIGRFPDSHIVLREATEIRWTDTHGGDFVENQLAVRAETRVSHFVEQPSAFIRVDLTP